MSSELLTTGLPRGKPKRFRSVALNLQEDRISKSQCTLARASGLNASTFNFNFAHGELPKSGARASAEVLFGNDLELLGTWAPSRFLLLCSPRSAFERDFAWRSDH